MALLVGGALLIYRNNQPSANDATDKPAESGINYGPPTETELQEADQRKNEIVESQNNDSADKNTLSPTITSASVEGSQIVVRGFVSGIVENDKDCVFIFRKSGETFARTTSSIANASTTNCGITLERSALSGTDWTVSFKYSSGPKQGESNESIVQGM